MMRYIAALLVFSLPVSGCAYPSHLTLKPEPTKSIFTAYTSSSEFIARPNPPYLCMLMHIVRAGNDILTRLDCYEAANTPEPVFVAVAANIPFVIRFDTVYSCSIDAIKETKTTDGKRIFAYAFLCQE